MPDVKSKPKSDKSKYNTILNAFKETEEKFEEYLMTDRVALLNKLPKAIEEITTKLNEEIDYLMKRFVAIQIDLQKTQNKNIFTMFKVDTGVEECKNEDVCYDFLMKFLEILKSLISVLTYENALHFKRIELTFRRKGKTTQEDHDKTLEEKLTKTISILQGCLRFLNKNSAEDVKDFFALKKSNEELFLKINNVRIFGYILRAYLKYILINRNLKYTISTSENEYVLNDCNKVVNILERDFRISEVQHNEDNKETKKYTTENRTWIYLSAIAANFLKGHVYYGMKNNARALDCFYRGMRLYDKVKTLVRAKRIEDAPFDIAKAKLMIGKIFSEKGLFLDSLLWYLKSLYDFLALFKDNNKVNEIREVIIPSIGSLRKEKHNDIIRKEIVEKILKDIPIRDLQIDSSSNSTAAWARGYISDLINRVGYVFYILLWKNMGNKAEERIKFWYEVALSISETNSLARQNLFLLPGRLEFNPEWLRTILDPGRRLNMLALLQLNMAQDGKNNLEKDILRSMLTNLENIITVPQKFNKKITIKRRIGEYDSISKLMCLRRWNSFTPVIPRPVDFNRGGGGPHFYNSNNCPGGGYFLIWNNKGIVIDPGFDFIRNLYSAGYSVSDIDAIVLTHAHVDHMSDFFALLTLIYERKDLLDQLDGGKSDFTKIDLFMNIGTMNGFLPWCASHTKDTICNIHSLPRNSDLKDNDNFILDLSSKYKMKIEITKSSHNESYTRDWAIGLKLHLDREASIGDIVLGITSDTASDPEVLQQYKDCDLLSIHLGDINFKEAIQFSRISLKGYVAQIAPKKLNDEGLANLKELAVSLGVSGQELYNLKDPKKIVDLIVEQENPYELKNHLGFKGAYELAKILLPSKKSQSHKLLIFSEFPEYFGSFRKRIARHFNERLARDKRVFVTGDLGLQVKIDPQATDPEDVFRIQCNKCARDNDILHDAHFHKVDDIQETCVKAADESIVYYCNRHRIEPNKFFINKITQ